MIFSPLDQFELAQAHQQQLRYEAELDRWAKAAGAGHPQRAASPLARLGARLVAPVLRLLGRGKAPAALGSSRAPAPPEAYHARSQTALSAARHHACLSPNGAAHPHHAPPYDGSHGGKLAKIAGRQH